MLSLSSPLRVLLRTVPQVQSRALHFSLTPPPVPQTTRQVPDVQTFLRRIGRNTERHASKIGDWTQLFGSSSAQLRELGVEPPRDRRYILRWRELYRSLEGRIALKEHKRGRKIDGGERRKKEVRAKRYQAERRAAEGIDR